MNAQALIFDLDGTLLDTNRQHARAWAMALKDFNYAIPDDRILVEIGKGGEKLVPSLLGHEAEDEHGEELRDAHGDAFQDLIEEEGVAKFDAIQEAFDWAEKRDLLTAVATASQEEELEKMLDIAGLDLQEMADVVVTDSDVDRSKPEPDTVTAAVEKLELAPTQCVMIGDTPYDAIACLRAGVTCLGVCTGPHSPEDMHKAGARMSFENLADLVEHIDEAMERAAPGSEPLTWDHLDHWMDRALSKAADAMKDEGEVPIGSILVDDAGTVVAAAHHQGRERESRIAHPELLALSQISRETTSAHPDLLLVTTVEPCVMCLGAAMEAGVDTVIYAAKSPANAGTERCTPPENGFMPRIVGGVKADASRTMLSEWLNEHPDDRFVRSLLQK